MFSITFVWEFKPFCFKVWKYETLTYRVPGFEIAFGPMRAVYLQRGKRVG